MFGIRTILRCGRENLTERQQARLARAIAADERHDEVHVAWQAAQLLRSAFHQDSPADGRHVAEQVLTSFPSCPIPEIARLGRTLRQWREPFLAYFTTAGASNGGTEAVNGLIELHRRVLVNRPSGGGLAAVCEVPVSVTVEGNTGGVGVFEEERRWSFGWKR